MLSLFCLMTTLNASHVFAMEQRSQFVLHRTRRLKSESQPEFALASQKQDLQDSKKNDSQQSAAPLSFSENSITNRINDPPDGENTDVSQLQPTKCVWAIISCCSPGSNRVRYPCFELLGCPGPFWDSNPCQEGIASAAVRVAGDFYDSVKQD
ncbi:hypothetical protein C0J52_26574 [Blattella germanica]|nr:hypothetical protein C0J52_26574 [Blattella germanica]